MNWNINTRLQGIIFAVVLSLAFSYTPELSAFAQEAPSSSAYQPNATQSERAWAEGLKHRAEEGSAEAQHLLSRAYMNGNVFRKSSKEAVYWCRLAAKQGFPGAEVNLGTLYYEGKGVPRDYSQTLYWMRKAADQGDAQGASP